MSVSRRLLLVLLLVIAAPFARADELAGVVVSVADGDTLRVLVEAREVVVRLHQIDAPERGQPFGGRSRQSLAELALKKAARVETSGHDRYGRTVGTVYVDGLDVNAEQVRRGMAWAYRRYVQNPHLVELEQEARAAGRGLWVDAQPVEPWVWRQLQHQP